MEEQEPARKKPPLVKSPERQNNIQPGKIRRPRDNSKHQQ